MYAMPTAMKKQLIKMIDELEKNPHEKCAS